MIEEIAEVVGIHDEHLAWIHADSKAACGDCGASKSCGTMILSNVFKRDRKNILALNKVRANIGDWVVVGIDERRLLISAFWLYIIPLAGLFVFAIIGYLIGNWVSPEVSEILAASLGIGGIAFGFYIAKIRTKLVVLDSDFEVRILRLFEQ